MPDTEDRARCYASALRILQYRWNSAAELRRKLKLKSFEPDDIDAAIERLTEEKWLDDQRFAAALARASVRKSRGSLRIRRELQAAGVDEEIAAAALAENVSEEDQRAAAMTLCTRKLAILAGRGKPVDSDEGRKKLTAFLLSKGYDPALVRDVIRTALHAPGRNR